MKRTKLLPSILMLVLCVGVLCMGIYAASPNSNQITGSITINAANPAVDIVAWTEDYVGNQTSTPQEIKGLRTGNHPFTFNSGLTLDFSSASEVSDVKPTYIKIEITNKSQKELGAYISTKPMTGEASKGDILTTAPMANSSAIDATSTLFYSHIGKASEDEAVITDSVILTLEFKPNALIETATPVTFNNYYVNIEEYNPNITTKTVTADQINAVDGFVKLSTTISETGTASLLSTTALSNSESLRTLISYDTGFKNLTTDSLEDDLWVVVPNSVSHLWENSFDNSTALTNITLPRSLNEVTAISGDIWKYLPSVTEGNIKYYSVGGNKYHIAYEVTDKTLTSYIINENTNILYDCLFRNCTNMTAIPAIPCGVKLIPVSCFNACTSVTGTLTIPENITWVRTQAFNGCIGITSIIIPKSIIGFSDGVFSACGCDTITYKGTSTEFYEIVGYSSVLFWQSVYCEGDGVTLQKEFIEAG